MLWSLLIISLIATARSNAHNKLNGETSQSSTYTENTTQKIPYGSERALDGDNNNCAKTLKQQNSWWRVDLKGVYSISCIFIYNKNQDNSNISGAQIHIGNSLDNNGTASSTYQTITDFKRENEWNDFAFDKNVSGRYVTVFFPGHKSLVLCEMKIYGTRKDSPFRLIKKTMTWENALYHCRDNDMDLASILDEETQAWAELEAKQANTAFVWLGLHYTCTLEFWFWVDDNRVEFSRWDPNDKAEDCDMSGAMEKNEDHLWFRKSDNNEFNFICAKQEKTMFSYSQPHNDGHQ